MSPFSSFYSSISRLVVSLSVSFGVSCFFNLFTFLVCVTTSYKPESSAHEIPNSSFPDCVTRVPHEMGNKIQEIPKISQAQSQKVTQIPEKIGNDIPISPDEKKEIDPQKAETRKRIRSTFSSRHTASRR